VQQTRLSELESRVYTAVTGLEARGEQPYPSAIQRDSELPEEQVRLALHSLVEKNLLHREDSPVDQVDFGPRWCASQPT
jgi:hypothetical protein